MQYLNERDIAINVLFFQVFNHGSEQLLSRAWLMDPVHVQVNATATKDDQSEPWNGEFYASFEGTYHREFIDDPQKSEYFVAVKWIKTVPAQDAVQEIGLFGNQNTVCKPTAPKWRYLSRIILKCDSASFWLFQNRPLLRDIFLAIFCAHLF